VTQVATHHLTWPCYNFNHADDLIPEMVPYLVSFESIIAKKHLPERIYYLSK
jgi:hypothetical protein